MTQTPPEPVVYTGRQTTAEENFLLDWGLETRKKTLEQLAGGLQRLVTLNAALLGGALVVPKDDVMPPAFRLAAMACFFLSLSASLLGSLPFAADLVTGDPDAVKAHKDRVEQFRWRCLVAAGSGLWAGLAVAAYGFASRVTLP